MVLIFKSALHTLIGEMVGVEQARGYYRIITT